MSGTSCGAKVEEGEDPVIAQRKYWDDFAETYAKGTKAWSNAIGATMIPHIRPQSCTKVLDLGCGPGNISELLHAQLAPEASLMSVDLSPNMVALTKALMESASKERDITIREANAQTLEGIEANTFDGLVSNLCIFMAPCPTKTLKRMWEVMKPGGRAVFSVWGLPAKSELFTIFPRAMKALQATSTQPAEGSSAGGEGSSKKPRSAFHLGENGAQHLAARVRKAGFKAVTAWHHMGALAAMTGEEVADYILSIQLRVKRTIAEWSKEKQGAIRAKVVELAQAAIDRGDPVGLDCVIVVAEK